MPAILCPAVFGVDGEGTGQLARRRHIRAERLQLVVEATGDQAARIGAQGGDPRLVDLVRLLARQAAREFVRAEAEAQGRPRPET